MKCTSKKNFQYVPNGGVAVLDENGKMIAYKKNPVIDVDGSMPNDYDWVRKDYRKS